MSKRIIRIGTRESQLALWQAHFVRDVLESRGHACEIVPITSDGEKDLINPIYEIGVTGVFTKTLDIAMLAGKIDIAVHSLKDVPTQLPNGIVIAAVPERGDHRDTIVTKESIADWSEMAATIATSSIRRKAQWLHRYPTHSIENIRGNVNSRLVKLEQTHHWDGAIFALAGIQRIGLEVPKMEILDWMLPAPAQGALGIACREDDLVMFDICQQMNHIPTRRAVDVERGFLRALMGGCATPIACYAFEKEGKLIVEGNVISLDEKAEKKEIKMQFTNKRSEEIAKIAAEELLSNGGRELVERIHKSL